MKAIVFEKYGSVEALKIKELPEPAEKKGEALVRIKAIGLNPRDTAIREGELKFLTGRSFPKLTGADFSGEVVSLPPDVKHLREGDEVFGYFERVKGGVSAKLCAIPVQYLAVKPKEITHKTAAAIGCAYLTAFQALTQKAALRKGQSVLIFGASGGVGTAATHIAKQLGAQVTVVSHSRNCDYCLAQGADAFVAYDTEDVFDPKAKYDTFFQVYSKRGDVYSSAKKVLRKDGLFVCLIPNPLYVLKKLFFRPKFDFVLVKANRKHLEQLIEWIQKGAFAPNIHREYSFDEYQDAFCELETSSVQGKIVIDVASGSN